MRKGFTLVEVLIYVSIFSIMAIVFSTALLTYTRVNLEQTARTEVASQLNFVMQTIQRMTGEAGMVVVRNDIGFDQGPLSPSIMANDSSFGNFAWSNVNNAKISDNLYASVTVNGNYSNYLKATGFGFSIPAGAIIKGIEVLVERYGDGTDCCSSGPTFIVKNGAIGSVSKAVDFPFGSNLESIEVLGSPTDLWNESWVASDINNSNTGFVISTLDAAGEGTSSFYIDQIMMAVYYSEGESIVSDVGSKWDEQDTIPIGEPYKYLILKTKNEGNLADGNNSPVVIYADNGEVKIRKGRGSMQTETTLTTPKVIVNSLAFTKLTNYPGRDVVGIDLSLSYNGNYPSQISRKLVLGVGRAEAAIFDTSLLPGTGNSIDLGQQTQRWRDGYFANNLVVGVKTDTNSLVVGLGGTPINGMHSGFFLFDPLSINANSNGTFTINSPNPIGASDRIFLTPPQDLEVGLVLVGATTTDASDTIKITLRNVTAAAVNGAAQRWGYLLIK